MEHLNYIIQTYPQVEGYVISIKHNLSQGFIQDFAFGGGSREHGGGTFIIGEIKNFAFFSTSKIFKKC